MKDIQLTLNLKEVNAALNALGNQPYVQVHQLIGKIQAQGSTQLRVVQNRQTEESKTCVTEKQEKVLAN